MRVLLAEFLWLTFPVMAAEAEWLRPGQSVQRMVAAGETVAYRIGAAAGSFVELEIGPRGTLVAVDVLSGQVVLRKRLANGQMLPAATCWLAGGESTVTLQSLEKDEGRAISLQVEVREATAADEAKARGCALAGDEAAKLETWQAALRAFEQAGDLGRQAELHTLIGIALWDLGRTVESVKAHERAVAMWERAGNPRRQAAAMQRLGVGLSLTNQVRRAKEVLRMEAQLAQQAQDRVVEADALLTLGMQHSREGKYDEGLAMVDKAIGWKREAGDRNGESEAQNNRGLIQQNAGLLAEAQAAYERSLELRRQLQDEVGESQILNNLATVFSQWGEPRKALALLEQALAIRKRVAGPQQVANTQHNLGVEYVKSGEHDRALQLFEEALAVWRKTKHGMGEAATLTETANAYVRLGRWERAGVALEEARTIQERLGDKRGQALAWNGLAGVRERQAAAAGDGVRQWAGAEEAGMQALRLAREGRFPQEEVRALTSLGRIAARQKKYTQAIPQLREAVELGRRTNRQDRIAALNLLGPILLQAGKPEEAELVAGEALREALAIENREGERTARVTLGRLALSKGDLDRARREVQLAIAGLEEQRLQVSSPDLRASFLAGQRDVYRLGADVWMGLGETREAFAVSEQGRARALMDVLEAARPGSAASGKLLDEERSMRQVWRAKAERLTRLLTAGAKAGEVTALRREIAAVADAQARLSERLAREDPRWARQTAPIATGEIQKVLGTGEAVVEFLLGEGKSYAWLVTSADVNGVTLAGRAEIERLAADFAQAQMENRPAGQRLSEVLLGKLPLRGIRKLYVVADGGLQVVPFGALEGLEGVELVMLPSAGLLTKLPAGAPKTRNVAVFADAVYEVGDARMQAGRVRGGEEAMRFPRLRFSLEEAAAITKLSGEGGMTATGLAATRATVLRAAGGKYSALHFAAHAVLDQRQPELSGIVMSLYDAEGRPVDGFVRMPDVLGMELGSKLVVLSACQTAIGKSVEGEGLMGLSRAFLAAGASGVVASLWQVDDAATAALMKAFYQGWLRQKLTPGKALQAAQRAVRAQPQWAHPYYWAGFVYSGR